MDLQKHRYQIGDTVIHHNAATRGGEILMTGVIRKVLTYPHGFIDSGGARQRVTVEWSNGYTSDGDPKGRMDSPRSAATVYPFAQINPVTDSEQRYEIDLDDFPSFSVSTATEAAQTATQLLEEDTPFHVEHTSADVWTFTVIDQEWIPFDPEPLTCGIIANEA